MNWELEARRILRSELVRHGITYQGLAMRLQAIGLEETHRSVANKLSRGTFSFVFFLQCMKAMGVESLIVGLGAENPRITESVSS